jgi:hypothetical protein
VKQPALDQRDLMSIARVIRQRSRPSLPRSFVMFVANYPQYVSTREVATMRLPRIN